MQLIASEREVELKLAIASDSARRAADREVARAAARSVETIYYDTPRRRLHAAGYSLRLRRDGEKWSQSVKSADASLDRFEQDHRLRGGLPDFSLLEGTPIANLVGSHDRLAPVFLTRVQRRTRGRAMDGGRIEVSLDEGEVIAHDRSWPILELELELKGGERGALFDHGRRLAADEAFVPAFMSKAERGYALVDGLLGEPVKFGTHPLDREMPASAAFRALARRCLRQLALNAELIAAGARLEAIHQARTSLRRLRVALSVFAPVVDKARSDAIEAELIWLTGELADARSLDVFMFETFRPSVAQISDRHAAAVFGKALLQAHERGHARAAAAVASPRFRLLLLDAARWVETGVVVDFAPGGGDRSAADFAAEALAKRRKALRRRLRTLDWRDPLERHKTRIAAKKMRYASEFFVGMGPASRTDAYDPFVKSLARLQDELGGLNDLTMAEPLVPAVLENVPLEGPDVRRVGYAAGLIMGRRLARSKKLTRSAQRAGDAFLDAPTWW